MRETYNGEFVTYYLTMDEINYFRDNLPSMESEIKSIKATDPTGFSLLMQLKNGRRSLTKKQLRVVESAFQRINIDYMALIDEINQNNPAYKRIKSAL